ncbi:hypothetical protein J6590_074316 [Homalodisca vitripennis]|nr:hypothetical protein J6590_074316 [Homalodisca vitripennis]
MKGIYMNINYTCRQGDRETDRTTRRDIFDIFNLTSMAIYSYTNSNVFSQNQKVSVVKWGKVFQGSGEAS